MAAIMAARGQGLVQDFDFFVVVDFEATCMKDVRIFPQEIIEFPAVLVDGATGRIESVFRRYVRPKHHPVLTQFCRELTGIRQEDVDGGVELGEGLWMHDSWLKAATAGAWSLAVVTWGDWDCRIMLESECRFKGIEKPSYFDRWINLRVTLQEAVRAAGLDWEGRLHCGLDDARNTARLLVELMRRGVKMTITGSLAPPPPIQQKEQQPQLLTSPCGGSSAPSLIQQKQQQPPQPHMISPCDGTSATCFCYCRVPTRGGVVSVPGPMQGKCFFGCGNWTPAMGPVCPYFVWTN
ncbi:hypothetical protein VPH35_051283 [Triticum aestivum]|uniref:Exonuclease domain-containing protein n=1 Tax=Triticum aestivum TaxID=4565 RepID=A0A077RR20_WHEAT|nr:ERI1 exoribonuclease 2-like [Triticum aestivum]CDM82495.1 unnamed protein product [Triticum aestivum]